MHFISFDTEISVLLLLLSVVLFHIYLKVMEE